MSFQDGIVNLCKTAAKVTPKQKQFRQANTGIEAGALLRGWQTHLNRVEAVLEDSVQHLAVESLLLLQILLQLDCDGIEALGAGGGVHILTPVSGEQVVYHHATQPLPVCIHPACIQTHITHAPT